MKQKTIEILEELRDFLGNIVAGSQDGLDDTYGDQKRIEDINDCLKWLVSDSDLANVSNCYGCKKEYTDRDREHGMCHKCWQPIIEK